MDLSDRAKHLFVAARKGSLPRARRLLLATFDDHLCGERNHERFNCEPLASSAQSRRQ
jgi:hypothetical protein